ncbi:MAG: hypothetical protein A2Z14_12350 [Chloroflexi bacterium RBG_16_48_8]|nr:MAG: hypothetical protein A2Z14_12350 [Chloroflexi bacterium RBG_16_48_8]
MNSERSLKILSLIGVGIILLLVSGCNMPSLNLTEDLATPVATATATEEIALETEIATQMPSETPEPVVTPTGVIPQGPTMTPLAVPVSPRGSLSDEGPWLLYRAGSELSQNATLFIVNEDGSGRSPVGLDSFPSSGVKVNPSGDRIAYIMPASESTDQVPHLMVRRVPDGEIEMDLPLISEEVWETLSTQDDLAEQILMALSGANAFEWSPHVGGHYLAFVAALDSPKLDLYRFDTWSDNIRPLTTGPYHHHQPVWSPSGEWILYLEIERLGDSAEWDAVAMSAVSFDGSVSKRLYEIGGNRQALVKWLNDTNFFVSEISDAGPRNLIGATISAGSPKVIYEGPVADPGEMSFDDLQTVVAFCLQEDEATAGVYFFNFDEGVPDLVLPGACRSVEWWPGKGVFVANGEEGTAFIRRTGEVVKQMDDILDPVALSPDGQWMVSYGEEGATVYTHIGVLIRQIMEEPVEQVLWKPDSTGLFIEVYARENPFSSHHLYIYDLEKWELQLVDLDVRGEYCWAVPELPNQ